MLKVWISTIAFILFIGFGAPMICRTGCNTFNEFIVATIIAILFYIALYYTVINMAETFEIELDKNSKRKVSIYIGIISLLLIVIFMYGFKSMESAIIIDLTNSQNSKLNH